MDSSLSSSPPSVGFPHPAGSLLPSGEQLMFALSTPAFSSAARYPTFEPGRPRLPLFPYSFTKIWGLPMFGHRKSSLRMRST